MKDMDKQDVKKILNEMVETKQIEKWGLDTYKNWRDVPYVTIKENRIYLCEDFIFAGATNIKTVYDCKDEKAVRRYLNYIIKHSDLLDKYYIDDVKKLKDVINY